MSQIKEIQTPDGVIYVEMQEAELPETLGLQPKMPGLPDGAEFTSALTEKAIDTMRTLKNTLQSTIGSVHEGIKKHSPNEWTLELSIGFKGKTNPIPVIVSGETDVALKVTAKWVKTEPEKKK